MKSFYITTPIYYVNDKPHIGHAYTTILADVLARYHRLLDVPTFFLTGTDEHGQKVAEAAKAKGIEPIEQCETTVVRFRELWEKLEITNDDFIRTTEDRHKRVVQEILQRLYDDGEIYKANYEGSYCTPCERFYTDKDLVEGRCPECNRDVDTIIEPNYFFRMGKEQEWLIEYIDNHPEFIQPAHRRNETLGFLRKPLGDLCISRPKSRLSWGIELPFDKDYVCYVWFDALINYIGVPGYGSDDSRFSKFWPATYHLIGKDILTTHTVYWPIMLKAIGIDLPQTIFAHGWWLVGKDKMGKSLGNVVDPMKMCDDYGIDAFRYFLLAEMTPGNDASFTDKAFIDRYNTDLADNLGNMLNRAVKLIHRYFDGRIPEAGPEEDVDAQLKSVTFAAVEQMTDALGSMKLDRGLDAAMGVVKECNRYFEQTAPWILAKEKNTERLGTVLYTAAESLRIVSGLLFPIMPTKMAAMREVLGLGEDKATPKLADLSRWAVLESGTKIQDLHSLFPRIETQKNESNPTKKNKDKHKMNDGKDAPDLGVIDISDVGKVKLKTAKIIVAEKIEGADRILRLEIMVGSEQRQIIAGIAQYYSPEELIGKTIVVVTNLKPATIRGVESNGMLLAAKDKDGLHLITADGNCESGAEVG